MNYHDDDNKIVMFFGAAFTAIVIGGFILSSMKNLFIELKKTFDAFGDLVGSTFFMMWNVAQFVLLLGLIVGGIVVSVYFTYKYVQMLKGATALKKEMAESLHDFKVDVDHRLESEIKRLNQSLRQLNDRLTDALEKPEIAPSHDSQLKTDLVETQTKEKPQGVSDENPESETITMSNPL